MPTVKSVSTPAEFSRARSPPIYRSSSLQRSSWSSISRPPRRLAHQAGIVLVHQEGAAVDQLSIGENVMLTLEPNQYGIIAWPALHERAASALGQLGVSADTQQRLGEHGGVALTELIEIARSIVRGGSVFVFDESTAALGVEEIGNLLQRMRELARSGASVIFISHRIQEILSICDRVVVIRDGRKVLDAPRAELDHATVVAAMLAGIANRQSSGRLAESPTSMTIPPLALCCSSRTGAGPDRNGAASILVRSILKSAAGRYSEYSGRSARARRSSSSPSSASLRVYLTEVFNGTASKGGRHLILIRRSKWGWPSCQRTVRRRA